MASRNRPPLSTRPRFNYLVHDVSRMRRTLFDHELKPYGITAAQWWLLATLSRNNASGMIQSELARELESGKVSVGGLIDRLEAAGLVDRRPDPNDGRARRIFVSDLGFDVLERIAIVSHKLDNDVFDGVSDEELAAAAAVLRRIKQNIRNAIERTGSLGEEGEADLSRLPAWSRD